MKKNNRKYSICITTYFDKNFEKIGNLSLKGMEKYAKKYGFDIKLFNNITSNRPPAWNKILIVQKLLEDPKKYDFIFWIDSDTLFWRFNEDIRQEIEENKDFYLVKTDYLGMDLPLSGAFLIRNSEWSKQFLKGVWGLKKYTYHHWWENAAIDDLLGFKEIIKYNKYKLFFTGILYKITLKHQVTSFLNKINLHKFLNKLFNNNTTKNLITIETPKVNKNIEKVKWLDLKWDSLTRLDEDPNPIIQHYPAMSFEERLRRMTEDYKRINKKS